MSSPAMSMQSSLLWYGDASSTLGKHVHQRVMAGGAYTNNHTAIAKLIASSEPAPRKACRPIESSCGETPHSFRAGLSGEITIIGQGQFWL